MAKQFKRLSELANAEDFRPDYRKPEEFVNLDLLLTGIEFSKGNFGEYAVMAVTIEGTGEQVTVTCGGNTIMAQLQHILETKAELPLLIQFKRAGRAWTIV